MYVCTVCTYQSYVLHTTYFVQMQSPDLYFSVRLYVQACRQLEEPAGWSSFNYIYAGYVGFSAIEFRLTLGAATSKNNQ